MLFKVAHRTPCPTNTWCPDRIHEGTGQRGRYANSRTHPPPPPAARAVGFEPGASAAGIQGASTEARGTSLEIRFHKHTATWHTCICNAF